MARAAAKKGVKRGAQEAKIAKDSKKAKVDPILEPVIEALEASSLPDATKAMLLAALPRSLCVASDLRGAAQARLVEMVKEVIEAGKAHVQSTLDDAEKGLETVMASKEALVQKMEDAEAGATAAKDVASATKAAVGEAQSTLNASCEALRAAKEAQAAGDAPLEECEARCRQVKAAIETLNAEVSAGGPESVLEVMRACAAAESLMVSMPAILAQMPAQRSDFENMAVKEAEKCLTDRVAQHEASLEAGAEGKKQRADAVEEAEQAQERAKVALEKADNESLNAEVERQNAVEALRVAKEALVKFDLELMQATSNRDEAKAQLQLFADRNVASFDRLRNKVSTEDAAPQAGA